MNKRFITALIGLVIFTAVLSRQMIIHEATLSQGREVYLTIGPKDPRSLMQGDYMILRYHQNLQPPKSTRKDAPKTGYVILSVDDQKVARFYAYVSPQANAEDTKENRPENSVKIAYKKSNSWQNWLTYTATSFFFEEGKAAHFEKARYIAVRVSKDGTALITHLLDENFNKL